VGGDGVEHDRHDHLVGAGAGLEDAGDAAPHQPSQPLPPPASLGALKTLQQLNLAGNQLTGTIPTELSQLEGLYVIDLSRNKLSGTIPTDLGGAQQSLLISVDLSDNDLTGTIPARIKRYLPDAAKYAGLHGLPDYGYTMFVLSGNKLTGKIPAEYLAYPKTLQLLLPQQAGYGFSHQPK